MNFANISLSFNQYVIIICSILCLLLILIFLSPDNSNNYYKEHFTDSKNLDKNLDIKNISFENNIKLLTKTHEEDFTVYEIYPTKFFENELTFIKNYFDKLNIQYVITNDKNNGYLITNININNNKLNITIEDYPKDIKNLNVTTNVLKISNLLLIKLLAKNPLTLLDIYNEKNDNEKTLSINDISTIEKTPLVKSGNSSSYEFDSLHLYLRYAKAFADLFTQVRFIRHINDIYMVNLATITQNRELKISFISKMDDYFQFIIEANNLMILGLNYIGLIEVNDFLFNILINNSNLTVDMFTSS